MPAKVYVAGVGMSKFTTPSQALPYTVSSSEAIQAALKDAGLSFNDIEQAYAGYVYGDSTCGQRAIYESGMTGIPIVNVNNNCSTGSSALYLARQAILSETAECVLALGFEQMSPGAISSHFDDRPNPLGHFVDALEQEENQEENDKQTPFAIKLFGAAGREHQERYGTRPETFARIAVKSRRHAMQNPYAVFREPLILEEVLDSKMFYSPVTKLQCCPPTCGAAAAIVCSESFATKHGLKHSIAITAQSLVSDTDSTFSSGSRMKLVGYGMTQQAASQVYEQAGIGAQDIDVIELHDCFTTNELISYEALGLCAEGEAEKFIEDKENTYGGQVVVNPSGGLLSKGHPLGATGLAQCAELVWQLRGQADKRQVEGARVALQHNLGLGGACVITVYQSN